MKKTKKRIIIALLFLFALAAGGFLYLNSVFLPVQLKEIITKQASKYLNRPITFDSIVYTPLHGVTIKNLRMHGQTKDDPALIHIEKASFKVILPAILRNKKIVIPSLNVQNPYIHIVRNPEKEWNFTDLLAARKTAKSKPPFDFFLGSVLIENARLEITDLASQPASQEIINIPTFKVNLSLEKGIKFKMDAVIPPTNSLLNLHGSFSPLTKEIRGQIAASSLSLSKYAPLLDDMYSLNISQLDIKEAALNFKWQDNKTDIHGGFTLTTDSNIKQDLGFKGLISAEGFSLTKEGRRIYITSALDIKNSQCTWSEDAYFTGNISAPKLEISYLDGDLAVRGNIDAPESFVQLSRTQTVKGLLATRGLDLEWDAPKLKVKGDFLLREGSITLSENQKIDTSIMIRDASLVKEGGLIDCNGQIETKKTNIDFPPHISLKGDLMSSPTRVRIENNKIHLETFCQLDNGDIIISQDKRVTGDFSLRNIFIDHAEQASSLKTFVSTKNLSFAYKDKSLQGQGDANIILVFNPEEKTLRYEGDATLKNTDVQGLPRFEALQSIEGTLKFANNWLETKGLKLKTRNTNISLVGTLTDFKHPLIKINASAKNFHIDSWQDIAQAHLDKMKIDPSGLANVSLEYEGPIPFTAKSSILANAFLYDVSLTGEKLPHDITNISGTLKYDAGSIEWSDLKGTYKDRDYSSSGLFLNKDRPVFTTEILSENLSLSSRMEKRGTAYKVDYFKGKFLQSGFDLKGDVNFNNSDKPDLNVSGKITVNLKNLSDLDPDIASYIYLANPLGVVSADASYQGSSSWQTAAITLNINSPKLSLYEMDFYNMNLTWQQKDFNGIFNFLTTFYDGAATLSGKVAVKDPALPFNATGQISKANLGLLGTDLNWKKKDISGLLSLDVTAKGSLRDMRQVEGKGSLALEQGSLGKTNLLKGVWEFLLIPEYENIIFNQGQSKFRIAEKKFSFNDIYLQSEQVDLAGNGWIDFNQNINFDLTANFKETAIARSKSLMKIPTQYIVQAAGFIGVRIGCTLTKPCHEKIIPKSKIIEKTTGSLLEGVQDIFESFLQ